MPELSGKMKPMGVLRSVAYYAVPAAILTCTHHVLVPFILGRTGAPYLLGYMIGWAPTMALFCVAAPVA